MSRHPDLTIDTLFVRVNTLRIRKRLLWHGLAESIGARIWSSQSRTPCLRISDLVKYAEWADEAENLGPMESTCLHCGLSVKTCVCPKATLE